MGGFRVRLDPLTDLEPIHAGHHNIKQNDIRALFLNLLERLLTIKGRHNVKIFPLQFGSEKFHVGQYVVNNKDASGHRCANRKRAKEQSSRYNTIIRHQPKTY